MKTKRIYILLALIATNCVYSQSFSSVDTCGSIRGTGIIHRVDNSYNYFVTCIHSGGDYCGFVVKRGNRAKFFSTKAVGNVHHQLKSGYIVKDVQIDNQVCYFCGARWAETGNVVYNIDGTSYRERSFSGFVGRFALTDVLLGYGNYEIYNVPSTTVLNRLSVRSGLITSIGDFTSGAASCLVEFVPNISNTGYDYRIMRPDRTDEVFMDITSTLDDVVVVSRYTNPNHYFDRYFNFGLRYALPGHFYETNTSIYKYGTYSALDSSKAGFISFMPLIISNASLLGNEIYVSYITSAPNFLNNLIIYKVPSMNGTISEMQYSGTNENYVSIKEFRCIQNSGQTPRMVVLLENSTCDFELRFPSWSNSVQYLDTILTLPNVNIQSVAPYFGTNNSFNISANGYYQDMSSRLVNVMQYHIHNASSLWCHNTCLSPHRDSMVPVSISIEPQNTLDDINGSTDFTPIPFISIPFTSSAYTSSCICSDGE